MLSPSPKTNFQNIQKMNTPKNQSFSDSGRSSPMQIERIVAEIQVSFKPYQILFIRED